MSAGTATQATGQVAALVAGPQVPEPSQKVEMSWVRSPEQAVAQTVLIS
jgi:hypothetical protein